MAYNPRHRRLRKDPIRSIIDSIDEAHNNAQSQRTSNSGSHFIPSGNVDEDGKPDGTGSIIGSGAVGGGIAPWVNDTTPPGTPTGVAVTSSASMILVSWDGTLDGGIPDDFDHIGVEVDGAEVGTISAKGTYPFKNGYETGSVHTVRTRAFDNAHDSEGQPRPNASGYSEELTVKIVSAADGGAVDEAKEAAQNAVNAAAEATEAARNKNRNLTGRNEPEHDGLNKGDLWFEHDENGNVVGVKIWDGERFVARQIIADTVLVPGSTGTVALADGAVTAEKVFADEALLKKLLVRKLLADEINVGNLAAAIVESNAFVTRDGNAGFDNNGFWATDTDGNEAFRANSDGVSMTGVFRTNTDGHSRFVIKQKDITTPMDKRSLGTIQYFNGQDNDKPILGITAWDNNAGQVLTIGPGDTLLLSEEETYKVGKITLSSNYAGDGYRSGADIDAQRVSLGHIDQNGATYISAVHSSEDFADSGCVTIAAEKRIDVTGDLYENGTPSYHLKPRLAFAWGNDWAGKPSDSLLTEFREQFIVQGPGEGRWYQLDMGARVQGPGEYGMRFTMNGDNGSYQCALLSSKLESLSADNFTLSRKFFVKNGTYTIMLQCQPFGGAQIQGDPNWTFKDTTISPKSLNRYLTIIEA